MQQSCTDMAQFTLEDQTLRRRRRWLGGVVAFLAGALLFTAAWLQPATDGHGTHTQLGLPACGWVVGMGIPCPSCGMTTSFAHAADGNLLGAMRAQPAGALLAIGTAFVFIVALWQSFTGTGIGEFWLSRMDKRFFLVGGVIVVLAWIYKILVFKGVF